MKFYLLSLLLFLGLASQATTYYVDASTTSSTQNGSSANPWKTLSQVQSNMSSFRPGDFILFKRGGTYTGTLNVNCSGSSGSPITFGAYGTGTKPKFTGTGSKIQYLIYVNSNKSYITFRDWWITDPSIDNADRSIDSKIQRAFTFDQNASYNKIVSCDIHLVGVAGYFIGGNNTMDSCDVGNLRMVVDTNEGYQPGNDDDYGANPLVISSSNNTVTHNYFHDCWATSYDYDFDGGAIELYGDGTNNNFIAYNTIFDCIGLTEITGNSSNNTYAYNKLINNGSLFYFQSGSTYSGYKFYNNVVIENNSPRVPESRLIGGSFGSNAVVVKNNIFHLSTGTDVAGSGNGITHEDNIYKVSNNSVVGYTLGSSELSTSAALFTNTSAASALSWNYTPVSGSPAIDFGQNVGLTKDFAGNNVPAVPNSGILESGGTTPTNPLLASSTATTINCNGGTSSVTVNASGGTAPYSGTGTFSRSAGTYSFTVTDAAGGSATTSIVIVEPAALSSTVVAGTAPSQSSTAPVTVTAGGGTPSYTYSLDGGSYQSSNVFPAVSVGSHSVTVRDGRACTLSKNFSVSAAGSTPLVITAITGTVSCNGGTTNVTISATGGRSPYTGTGTFTVNAGAHTYTVTDANGTTGTYTVTITQPSAISVSASATAITVAGGVSTVTVSATGGTAPFIYRIGSGSYQSSGSFTNILAGTYTVTVQDSKGCTATKSITITQPNQTAAFSLKLVSKSNLTCRNRNDGKIVVAGNGGTAPYQYRINYGSYQSSGTFQNLRPGFYVVTGKDAAGTTSSIFTIISNSSASCNGSKNPEEGAGASARNSGEDENIQEKAVAIEGMKITAYPNPTTTEWSLLIANDNIDEYIHVVVMNMNGQKVYQGKTKANQKINFGNNLGSGMYIAKITQGNTTETMKLVKSK